MNKIITVLFKIKFLIHGIRNLIIVLFKGNAFSYLKLEKEIIESCKKYHNNRVLVISGGSSLNKYWDQIKKYNYIILNSYNTLNILDAKQFNEIKDKIIIYYQAPFHHPIDLKDYNKNVKIK